MPVLYFTFDASGVSKGAQQAEASLERLLKTYDMLVTKNSRTSAEMNRGFSSLAKRIQDIKSVGEAIRGVAGEVELLSRSTKNIGFLSGTGKKNSAFASINKVAGVMAGPYGMAASGLISLLSELCVVQTEAEQTAKRYGLTLAEVSVWAGQLGDLTRVASGEIQNFTEYQKEALRLRLANAKEIQEEAFKKIQDKATIKGSAFKVIGSAAQPVSVDIDFKLDDANALHEIYQKIFSEVKTGSDVTEKLVTSLENLKKVAQNKKENAFLGDKSEYDLIIKQVDSVLLIIKGMIAEREQEVAGQKILEGQNTATAVSYGNLAAAMEAASGKPQNYEQAIRLLDNLTGSTEEGRKATIEKTKANAAEAIALLERGAAAQFAAAAEAGLNAIKVHEAGDTASLVKNMQLQAEAFYRAA